MLTIDSTTEDLDKSLNIPSFEEELALSDYPKKSQSVNDKGSRYVKCKLCGANVLVGPHDIFKCPNSPHDVEDDSLSELDVQDIPDETEDDNNY